MFRPAESVVGGAWSRGLRPDAAIPVSDWADKNRIIPAEASPYPGKWRTSFLPFLKEIMDCLSPSNPCRTVTLRKSAQVGGSECATNWIGYIIDVAPAPTLYVHPTVEAGKAWAREKLDATIEETPPMRRKVVAQKSREARGSTSLFKRFAGGFLIITGANSTAALRQKSIRNVIKDDWDDWPLDVDGQGDPDRMANARQIAYTAAGLDKALQVSTPTIKGASRVDAAYEKSDQREFYVPCPQCEHEQILRFKPKSIDPFRGGLKFEKTHPHNAYYVCEENGCVIEHHQKKTMLAGGRWIAAKPGEGRQPGFAINALYSPVTTWDTMAAAYMDAKDDPRQLKTFINLWLGEVWEERGEAPEWELISRRRERDWEMGSIPAGGLILTGFADVQKDGFFYEIVAHGRDRRTWVIDAGFIAGDTADTDDECWKELTALIRREYPNAYGRSFSVDRFGIDSGYNASQVYHWVRKEPKAIPCKGVAGWSAPALGAPSKMDIRPSGKKAKYGVKVYPIGTWSLKSALYSDLRKESAHDGEETFPPGYCHFPADLSDEYFKQLTAEYLASRDRRDGTVEHIWKVSGENHFHDCRIGNLAMLDHPRLLVRRWKEEKWDAIAADRETPPEDQQPDLESVWSAPINPNKSTPPEKSKVAKPQKVDNKSPESIKPTSAGASKAPPRRPSRSGFAKGFRK